MMKIVFATDGSQYATYAADLLKELAPREPVSLSVLTVTYKMEQRHGVSVAPWFLEWRESEMKRVKEHQGELCELLKSVHGTIHMEHREGSAAHEILTYADEIGADLIVVGARGHSAVGRLLLGSVSDSVATQAKCSVLVVRPSEQEIEPGKLRMTVAYDASDGSKAATAELTRYRWQPGTEANLLSVTPVLDFFSQEFSTHYMEHFETELAHTRSENELMTSQLAKHIPTVNSLLSKGNHIGETIVSAANDNNSDLIVLGDTRRSFLGRIALGSTTNYVLRHAEQSVWVSRFSDSKVNEIFPNQTSCESKA